MRTDVNMLGRNMSAFRNACPLESSIRGSSVSIIRNMKRQKTTASIIEDKQVVVVGGNRGIGLEVQIFIDCQICSIGIFCAHKAGWQGILSP